jgi:hypothetical protein
MFDAKVKYRLFEPISDGKDLVAARVLVPGEAIRWISDAGIERYAVDGRSPDGKVANPKRERARRAFWLFAIPSMIAGFLSGSAGAGPQSSSPLPRVVVFGEQPRCMAVFADEPRLVDAGTGLWVLTDRRFVRVRFDSPLDRAERFDLVRHGRVELPVEPMEHRVEFEIGLGSLRVEQEVERSFKGGLRTRHGWYRRITLPDASGFDIAPEAIADGGFATPNR